MQEATSPPPNVERQIVESTMSTPQIVESTFSNRVWIPDISKTARVEFHMFGQKRGFHIFKNENVELR